MDSQSQMPSTVYPYIGGKLGRERGDAIKKRQVNADVAAA